MPPPVRAAAVVAGPMKYSKAFGLPTVRAAPHRARYNAPPPPPGEKRRIVAATHELTRNRIAGLEGGERALALKININSLPPPRRAISRLLPIGFCHSVNTYFDFIALFVIKLNSNLQRRYDEIITIKCRLRYPRPEGIAETRVHKY